MRFLDERGDMRVDRIVRSYRKQYNQEIVIRRLHECAVMTWENLNPADLNAAKQTRVESEVEVD